MSTQGSTGQDVDISEDVKLLASVGYTRELKRRMSSFSNFAISFSIICILAGGITSLQLGTYAVGGAAAGIAWPIGVIFAFIVALAMVHGPLFYLFTQNRKHRRRPKLHIECSKRGASAGRSRSKSELPVERLQKEGG